MGACIKGKTFFAEENFTSTRADHTKVKWLMSRDLILVI